MKDDASAATANNTSAAAAGTAAGIDSLSLSIAPKYDAIGLLRDETETQVCATVESSAAATAWMLSSDNDDDSKRAPVHIVVALDVSGSMAGSKLSLCKRALPLLLRSLQPTDRFGLVCYGTDATVDVPIRFATDEHREKSLRTIRDLKTRGQTNMGKALQLAFEQLYRGTCEPNEVRCVFLLTDGHANTGITDPDAIVAFASKCASKAASLKYAKNGLSRPINLFTFGYGQDHNVNLLEGLADSTEGGSYYFVEDVDGVGEAFGDALGGVFSVVAQNAVVIVDVPEQAAAEGVSVAKIHHDKVVRPGDGSFAITVGDVYAQESRDVVIDVVLAKSRPKKAKTTSVPHIVVSLAYTDTLQKKLVATGTLSCSIARPKSKTISDPNPQVLAHCLRVKAVEDMKAAAADAAAGRSDRARQRYQGIRDQIQGSRDGPAFRSIAGTGVDAMLASIQEDTAEMMSDLATRKPTVISKKSATVTAKYAKQRSQVSAGGSRAFHTSKKQALSSRLGTKSAK